MKDFCYVFTSRDQVTHMTWYMNTADSLAQAREDRKSLRGAGCPIGPLIKVPIVAIPKKRKTS